MEVTGKLHQKEYSQEISATFKKRDFVLLIEDNPQYPQYVLFQLTQERCAFLDIISVGTQIRVDFNLRGRQWTNPQGETKYFNTLEVWRIMAATAQNTQPQQQNVQPQQDAPQISVAPVITIEEKDSDDLPF